MTGVQPMPCPVLLGTVKIGGLPALLHRYTIEKKVAKLEKVLKKVPPSMLQFSLVIPGS
ncbi:hypothetical protein PO909_022690 [Leuciscus waleckii]